MGFSPFYQRISVPEKIIKCNVQDKGQNVTPYFYAVISKGYHDIYFMSHYFKT